MFNQDTFDGCFIESLDELHDSDFAQRRREQELELLRQLKEKYGKEGQA